MPTLPESPQSVSPHPESHQVRSIAEAFGADPARYDRTRQPYPVELVRRIVAASPGRRFLDVGCGTGIEARQFAAEGCEVLGVEPDVRMAAFARERGTEVEVARFEDWADGGRTFDAVVSATAWHWVDPVAGAAKAARVLESGGLIALFWHVAQPPAALGSAFMRAYQEAVPDSPLPAPTPGRSAAEGYEAWVAGKTEEGFRAAGVFGEAQRWRYEWSRECTKDEWLDGLPTSGILAAQPPERQAEVVAEVAEVIDDRFEVGYTTIAVTALRD
ncbi:MAG TPA: class I SAM-dependent methyltransferase [Pseudonocardiaceae bacterium]|jgi:SAM-dependent methyltransferase|nr:class I SAM-dependent methyltransferase [Pseudonocardiaceae bacterium]